MVPLICPPGRCLLNSGQQPPAASNVAVVVRPHQHSHWSLYLSNAFFLSPFLSHSLSLSLALSLSLSLSFSLSPSLSLSLSLSLSPSLNIRDLREVLNCLTLILMRYLLFSVVASAPLYSPPVKAAGSGNPPTVRASIRTVCWAFQGRLNRRGRQKVRQSKRDLRSLPPFKTSVSGRQTARRVWWQVTIAHPHMRGLVRSETGPVEASHTFSTASPTRSIRSRRTRENLKSPIHHPAANGA